MRHDMHRTTRLEGAGVAVAALLDPQVAHLQRLLAEALRPKQVGVALIHADNILVVDALRRSRPRQRKPAPSPAQRSGAQRSSDARLRTGRTHSFLDQTPEP